MPNEQEKEIRNTLYEIVRHSMYADDVPQICVSCHSSGDDACPVAHEWNAWARQRWESEPEESTQLAAYSSCIPGTEKEIDCLINENFSLRETIDDLRNDNHRLTIILVISFTFQTIFPWFVVVSLAFLALDTLYVIWRAKRKYDEMIQELNESK